MKKNSEQRNDVSRRVVVSIILPCFNAEKTLCDTLESISQQSFRQFEVIAINDGSTDNTCSILKEFKDVADFPVFVIDRENRGFQASLTEGIMISQGDLIARIDADDLWSSTHLELITNEMLSDPSLVLVGANAKIINEQGVWFDNSDVPLLHDDIVKHLLWDNPFIHSSVVFSREVYDLTGGYSSERGQGGAHVADYRLWFEFSQKGQCRNLPGATISYRVLQNSMSRRIGAYENYEARLGVMASVFAFYKKNRLFYIVGVLVVRCRMLQAKIKMLRF